MAWERAQLLEDVSPGRTAERFAARPVFVRIRGGYGYGVDATFSEDSVSTETFVMRYVDGVRSGNRIRYKGRDYAIRSVSYTGPRGKYAAAVAQRLDDLSALEVTVTADGLRVTADGFEVGGAA